MRNYKIYCYLKKIIPTSLKFYLKEIYFSLQRKIIYYFLQKKLSTLDYHRYAGKKILVLVPHPDDEILGCGGLLLTLCEMSEVTIVYFTQGEKGLPFIPPDILRKKRMALRDKVLKNLNVGSIVDLKLPDGLVPSVESSVGQKCLILLTRIITAKNINMIVFPTAKDPHRDHQIVAGFAKKILSDFTAIEGWGFYVWSWWKLSGYIQHIPTNVMLPLSPSIFVLKKKLIDTYFSDKTKNGIPYSGTFPMGMFLFLRNMNVEIFEKITKTY